METLIEQKTNYAYKLKYLEDITFDGIRNLVMSFINDLPNELLNELYEELQRGVILIDSEPQMLAYLFSFGPMHKAKLDCAFEQIPKIFFRQNGINIIDYGCGQALGTICYSDFLKANNYTQSIKSVTLIEPSEICLKRAALHVSKFFPDASISTIHKDFDKLEEDDLSFPDEDINLHILSNVLDITEFDLKRFANLLSGIIKGYNIFVCVGPYFKLPERDERIERFFSRLNGEPVFQKYYDKYELNSDKPWTGHMNVFSLGESYFLNQQTEHYNEFERKKLCSCYNEIADCYYEGKETAQNYGKAVEWFKKSAELGDAVGQYRLGNCYFFEKGVTQDYTRAVEWYRKSAKQGCAQGQNNLGVCYEHGKGITQDYTKAVEWYRKSAEQGEPIAQGHLGICYYFGKGVTKNYGKAVEWYRKAAEQGLAEAQSILGDCYYYGEGVTKDYGNAVE